MKSMAICFGLQKVPAECPPSAPEGTETKEGNGKKEEKGIEAKLGARVRRLFTPAGMRLKRFALKMFWDSF